MFSNFRILLTLVTSLIFVSCQREASFHPDQPETDWAIPSPVVGNLTGTILDENGIPAGGVIVSVGTKHYSTDATGMFRINNAQLDKKTSLITAEKQGYFKSYRVFSATSNTNYVRIQLTKKTLAGSINSANGGSVASSSGAIVTLDPNGVVNAQTGTAYSGKVKVYCSYIDPSLDNISYAVPGSFLAKDRNNKQALLTSYGMVAVELESEAGEKLQIASGKKAGLVTPIPQDRITSAPAKISMWYVDEKTGVWQEEGSASLENDHYMGEVKHFSFWNCDISGPVVSLSLTLQSSDGSPLAYQDVVIKADSTRSPGFGGTAYGISDSLGNINGPVPANVPLVLVIYDNCGAVRFSYPINALSNSTDLGIVVIPASNQAFFRLKGRIVDCNGQVVANGYISCFYDHIHRESRTDANGNFSLFIPLSCSGSAGNLLLTAVNPGLSVLGSETSLAVTTPTTEAGDIVACGGSSGMFIKYTVDGETIDRAVTEEELFSIATGAYTNSWGNSLGLAYTTTVYSSQRNPDYFFSISFGHNTLEPGTYQLETLITDKYPGTKLVQPVKIDVNEFAQRPGQYYTGHVTGQFKDSADLSQTHHFDLSFRIKWQ